jgi:sigma-B regulation protein RsbU (phosphoserine phosphatase)
MTESSDKSKKKIAELEQALFLKENQLKSYRLQLTKTNQQLEKMIFQVNQELKIASLIQKALSPTELPRISGFEFSTKFVSGSKMGGDYFDIFEHDDRLRFGLLLSSASGYSMSALFLSILMKISSRIESRNGLSPSETLLKIYYEMRPHLGTQDRASLFYGLVDKRTYEIHFAATGNLTVYKQSADLESLEVLENQGPPLDKNYGTELRTQILTLDSRDRLILCSEGVTEALSPQGEAWGTSRLIEAIRSAPRNGVHELRNEIIFRLEKFIGSTEPQRDLTVLVMEVKDRVIKLAKQ